MMNLRKFANVVLVLGLFMCLFSACNKDESLTPENNPLIENIESINALQVINNQNGNTATTNSDDDDECFDFVYPVTINVPGSGNQTANSMEEIEAIIENFFEENLEGIDVITEFPTMVFPINVVLEDGTTQTVNSDEDLCEILHECYDEEWEDEWEDEWDIDSLDFDMPCFEFVFPLTINFPDGSSTTVNSNEEIATTMENWYTQNPNSDDCPTLAFPLTVMLEDGTNQTVNDEEALEDLFDNCFEDEEFYEDCFEIGFPLTLSLLDGGTTTVNSEEELENFFETWFEQNPDINNFPEIVFPINVILEDGTTQSVASEEDLEDLFMDCEGGGSPIDGSGLILGNPTVVLAKATLLMQQKTKVSKKVQ